MDDEIEGTLESLQTMNTLISHNQAIKQETATLKSKIKETQATLNTLKSTPSVAALTESITQVEEGNGELKGTLKTLQISTAVPIDPGKRAAAEANYERIEKVFLCRRRQFNEIWGMITEAYPGDLVELWVRTSPLSRNSFFPGVALLAGI
jgi:chromosome segregation ATPase